ncbi:hypothetical protein TNCV_656221 [Trichonephila clavipes]|nr:hypothetical protein TNCV_656221 [Trichonephila clavipes]
MEKSPKVGRLVDVPCCWPGGSFGVCRKKLLGAVDTRRYPRAENRVWSDQEDIEERDRRIVRQALVDPTVTRSTIRADIAAETGTSATASTVVPSQINVECHRLAKGCV